MAYDTFYLGWAYETTHGTSLIVNAASTAYKLGSVANNCFLPDPEWRVSRTYDYGDRKAASIVKTRAIPKTQGFAMLPHNALPVYWALGKSSTAATVHTLTAQSQASGIVAELPSLTFHAERIDGAGVLSDWATQWKGCRNAVARFFCGDDHPELTAVMGFMGTSAADPGFVLTAKPADVTGTHTAPNHYLWAGSTHTYDGTTVDGVTYWEIAIENGTHAAPPDYGTYYPSAVYQGPRQTVALTIRYRPRVDAFYDDLLTSTVPAKDWEFEFVRHATDDKLKFTCTTATTTRHPVPVPSDPADFEVELYAEVTSLTVTATDQINASFYGE